MTFKQMGKQNGSTKEGMQWIDLLGRQEKNLWLNFVLNGELLMHVTERKTADMYRKKPGRQHYDTAAAISLRLEKESNLVVGNLTGSYSCSLHCLVYSSNTSRKSSQPLSGIRMELRKLPFTSLMVMYRPCAFFLQEKKKFLFSILTCLD